MNQELKVVGWLANLYNRSTRQANQCLRGRTGHRGEGKAEAEPPPQESTGCGGNISPKGLDLNQRLKVALSRLVRGPYIHFDFL